MKFTKVPEKQPGPSDKRELSQQIKKMDAERPCWIFLSGGVSVSDRPQQQDLLRFWQHIYKVHDTFSSLVNVLCFIVSFIHIVKLV